MASSRAGWLCWGVTCRRATLVATR